MNEFKTSEELNKEFQDQSKLNLVVDLTRIGANRFGVTMEYTYFAPRSGKNYLFEMTIVKWPEINSMTWAVISFPIEFRPQAEQVAEQCGLRIADGVPCIIEKDGNQFFPINGKTVFTLENTHNHPIYQSSPAEIRKLRNEENAACEAIFNADKAKLKKEMQAKGYSEVQFNRIFEKWDRGDVNYDEQPEGEDHE